MNSKTLTKNEKPLALVRQPTPSIYALLNHDLSDIERLPVTPTLLTFKDASIEEKYLNCLFYSHNKRPSREFKINLSTFLVIYTLYMVSTSVHTIFHYINKTIPVPVMVLKLILLGFCSTIVYILIYLLLKSSLIYKNAIKTITIFGCSLVTLVVLTDFRVLSLLTGTSIKVNSNSIFLITTFSFLLKNLVFDTFRSVLIINLWSVFVFSIGVVRTSDGISNNLYEIFLLFSVFAVICVNTYRYEHTSKDIFWKSELKVNLSDSIDEGDLFENNSEEMINTEVEILLQICERIKKGVKFVSSMIIYKDIKAKLKVASNEIDSLKRRIAGEVFRSSVKLDHNHLDDQDKTFISQMFMQVSLKTTTTLKKFPTIKDLTPQVNHFSLSPYQSDEILQALGSAGEDWNFDIWFIHQTTGHSIYIIGKYVFHKWSLCEEFQISLDTFDSFFKLLEKKYHQNPYHNACHAADVLNSFLYFCNHGELFAHLLTLETLSSILACLAHDVSHPALTNRFLIQNRDDLAIQYNDSSVLENMHAYTTFHLLSMPGCNILSNLASDDWIKVRKLVIELILDTDMSRHFEILGRFRARTTNLADFGLDIIENKIVVLSMAVKCADLGHSGKRLELHERWTALICEEFFRQGDLEKERRQEISMYCDRFNTDVPKSQAGFIRNICLPLYETWAFYLKAENIKVACVDQMKANLEFWTRKDCSRRNLRSVSSSRLQKIHDKSPTVSRKFLYVGDEPRKIDKIIQRSTTPERSETPTVNYFRPEYKTRPISGVNSRKRLESQYKASFKRRVFKENPQSTRYFTNLFIEQLVSVPICERKNQNQGAKKSISKQKSSNKIDIYQKINRQKGTMTELNEPDRLIIYCDPFTIEETESICSPIKPKYL